MRKSTLEDVCAKRIQSNDFALPQSNQLLTKTETIIAVVMITGVATILSYMTFTTYFA